MYFNDIFRYVAVDNDISHYAFVDEWQLLPACAVWRHLYLFLQENCRHEYVL